MILNNPIKNNLINDTSKTSKRSLIFNNLFKKNPVLVGGMVIAPIAVYATTFEKALVLVLTFSIITYFTLIISSFIPKKIVYAIRIVLYTLIGSLVYVPTVIILNYLIPDSITNMGIYFPLLITNSFIVSRSETMFFLESKSRMLLDVIFCIIGYDLAVLLFGFIREIISTGEINGKILAAPFIFNVFSHPFGGFILLGIISAIFRFMLYIINEIKS